MCQLILTNINSEILNKIFLANLVQIDSLGNKDGTGICGLSASGKPVVWKSARAGDSILNLGVIINKTVKSDSPVIAHVRAASKNINVTDENAHPFTGKRFVLAHNGRLYGKDDHPTWAESSADTGLASDSMKFLEEMEKLNKDKPGLGVVEILQTCMAEHMGKFALMIFDKEEGKHYVVRGDSADLHYQAVFERVGTLEEFTDNQIGFVVNTRKVNLSDANTLSIKSAQVVTGKYIVTGEIVELDKNSVYVVDGVHLNKVGEVKENPVRYTQNTQTSYDRPALGRLGTQKSHVDLSKEFVRKMDRIWDFAHDHFLTFADIDALLYIFVGLKMAQITEDGLSRFIDHAIPKISARNTDRDRVGRAVFKGGQIHSKLYTELDMAYPWMINTPEKINQLVKSLEEKKEAQG